MTIPQKTALVICYSLLESDPRVTRQIDWLAADGWTVDTVGFGLTPRPSVRNHFQLAALSGVRGMGVVRFLIHALLPKRLRFRALEASQIPAELTGTAVNRSYDLVLANEIDLLPWVAEQSPRLLSKAEGAHVHVDVHEYHRWAPPERHPRIARWLFEGYHRWLVSFIGDPRFATRSTVAARLAEMYADDFGIPLPAVVRNAPAFIDQKPSAIDPDAIDLVYHGYAELARGLHLLIEAMAMLEPRFVLNLMLTGSDESKAALASMSADLGDRIRFVDAVPMHRVASALNRFDLELIFLPPTSTSFEFALPNKFFEAVQARLGVVTGHSVSMTEITDRFGNALVVDGWTAGDLSRAINSLTAEDVRRLKNASDTCADELNSGNEAVAFRASITLP